MIKKNLTLADVLYSGIGIFIISIVLLLNFCYIGNLGILEKIIKISCYFITTFMLFTYIFSSKHSKFSILVIIYFLLQLFSTIISSTGSIHTWFMNYYSILGTILYLERSLQLNVCKTFTILNKVFYILVFINFITIILYPNGLYATERYTTNWFFQYDNTHIFMFLPAIAINIIYNSTYRKKYSVISTLSLLSMISYCVYYCNSSNTVFNFTILLLYLIFRKKINSNQFFNIKNYTIIGIVLFLLIIVFKVQNIFYYLVVNVLNKSLTFTGRTDIWDSVISFIMKRPIFGYGIETDLTIIQKIGNLDYVHAHNTILDVLYRGGIISLIPFIMFIKSSIEKLNNNSKDSMAKFLSFIMLCIFIMMIFEARETKVGFYIILLLSFNIGLFLKRDDSI